MPGWSTAREYAELEFIQCQQEGRLVGDAPRLVPPPTSDAEWLALADEWARQPFDPQFPYQEPNDLDALRALRPSPSVTLPSLPTNEALRDRFEGAWLGRCIGCALGLPLEADPFTGGGGGRPGWKNIELWYRGADAWPIRGYVPERSRAQAEYGLALNPDRFSSTREHLAGMVSDDDIRYTVLGLMLLEAHGDQFDAWTVGKFWHQHLPYALVCTAETQAYLNFAQVTDHLSGTRPADWQRSLDWVRHHRNPYREWIGAQIRVDGYAYGAAGQPERAAEWAFRDASFSHVKNGVYGAMFCAAMIAAAFAESDPERIVAHGLQQIPAQCRLAEAVRAVLPLARGASSALELVDELEQLLGHYHWIHTINNAALVAAALVFGRGDFEATVTTAVLGGWDTDCNGATAGSLAGALVGARGIPRHWSAPLDNTLSSLIPGFHPIAISEAARRSYEAFTRLR